MIWQYLNFTKLPSTYKCWMFSDFHITLWMRKFSYFFSHCYLLRELQVGLLQTDLWRSFSPTIYFCIALFIGTYHFKQRTLYNAKLKRDIPLFLLNGTLVASLVARPLQRAAIKDRLKTVWFTHSMSMFRWCWFDKWKFYFICSLYVFKLYGRSLCSDKKWKNSSKLEIL